MSDVDMNEWNKQVIAEFRANEGKVGGRFEGAPMVLLHTTGAKSGLERVNPLMYRQAGDEVAIFASKAGATTHPDWYHNISANPSVTAEIGTETTSMRARVAEGEERDRIWEEQKRDYPGFAEYEVTAGDRRIPVVLLSR